MIFFLQAYLWEQNQAVVEWLEDQRRADSIVIKNINAVKRDAVISQIQRALEVSFKSLRLTSCINGCFRIYFVMIF